MSMPLCSPRRSCRKRPACLPPSTPLLENTPLLSALMYHHSCSCDITLRFQMSMLAKQSWTRLAALLPSTQQTLFVTLGGSAGQRRTLITKKRKKKMRHYPQSHQKFNLDFLSIATFPSVSAKVISFFRRWLSSFLIPLSFTLFASIHFSTEAITCKGHYLKSPLR